MDEWKRFANAAVQEELIAKAEALRRKTASTHPRDRRKTISTRPRASCTTSRSAGKRGGGARAQAQALWHRYRQAADPIQARLREFFSHRNEERKVNLEKKLALIARAEQIADSTDWIKTADELKKLQAEWQQIGPVPRQDTKTTWKQFRDACDRFFTRRNADLAERKETWSANLTRKEALCARAEELASSREWIGPPARSAGCRPSGRRLARSAGTSPKRSGSASLRVRHVLRSLQAARRDRARVQAGRSRTARRRAGGARAGGRQRHEWSRPVEPARAGAIARSRWNQSTPVVRHGADPLSARFVSALERTLPTSRCVQGHRARHRAEPAEDGEARVAGGRLPDRRRAAAGQLLTSARRHAARGARLEHDRRPCR